MVSLKASGHAPMDTTDIAVEAPVTSTASSSSNSGINVERSKSVLNKMEEMGLTVDQIKGIVGAFKAERVDLSAPSVSCKTEHVEEAAEREIASIERDDQTTLDVWLGTPNTAPNDTSAVLLEPPFSQRERQAHKNKLAEPCRITYWVAFLLCVIQCISPCKCHHYSVYDRSPYTLNYYEPDGWDSDYWQVSRCVHVVCQANKMTSNWRQVTKHETHAKVGPQIFSIGRGGKKIYSTRTTESYQAQGCTDWATFYLSRPTNINPTFNNDRAEINRNIWSHVLVKLDSTYMINAHSKAARCDVATSNGHTHNYNAGQFYDALGCADWTTGYLSRPMNINPIFNSHRAVINKGTARNDGCDNLRNKASSSSSESDESRKSEDVLVIAPHIAGEENVDTFLNELKPSVLPEKLDEQTREQTVWNVSIVELETGSTIRVDELRFEYARRHCMFTMNLQAEELCVPGDRPTVYRIQDEYNTERHYNLNVKESARANKELMRFMDTPNTPIYRWKAEGKPMISDCAATYLYHPPVHSQVAPWEQTCTYDMLQDPKLQRLRPPQLDSQRWYACSNGASAWHKRRTQLLGLRTQICQCYA